MRKQLRDFLLSEVLKVAGSEVEEEHISALFLEFDDDKNGYVTAEEFRKAALKLGVQPDAEQLELLGKPGRMHCFSQAVFIMQ
jgi:Ca2+-binding EF-hand superfamily protein